MFVNSNRLPHLLSPSAYYSAEFHRHECERMLDVGWHAVASTGELALAGDFITLDLWGHPIQIRNFDGQLRALCNVCSHRHCLLTHANRGNSDRMQCQYHGWEYAQDGKTARIPEAKNFAPFDRDALCLPSYRLEVCGQIIFVSLATSGPSLPEYLGDYYELCAERFNDQWVPSLCWNPDYPANWKVPIENSLEAYHVPCIHAQTFRNTPAESVSEHILSERSTSFTTDLPFHPHSRMDALFQRLEGFLIRSLGESCTGKYSQHHVFPNLLFSFTDAISLCHCILPTGPTTCRAVVRQFGRLGRNKSAPQRRLAKFWGGMAAGITRKILLEDLALFADIQRGLQGSPHVGVLGRCEERIHSFQEYLMQQCGQERDLTKADPESRRLSPADERAARD